MFFGQEKDVKFILTPDSINSVSFSSDAELITMGKLIEIKIVPRQFKQICLVIDIIDIDQAVANDAEICCLQEF